MYYTFPLEAFGLSIPVCIGSAPEAVLPTYAPAGVRLSRCASTRKHHLQAAAPSNPGLSPALSAVSHAEVQSGTVRRCFRIGRVSTASLTFGKIPAMMCAGAELLDASRE